MEIESEEQKQEVAQEYDLDLSTTANCGVNKCFLNAALNSSLGYLVFGGLTSGNPQNMSAYDVMFKSWELPI